MRILSVETQTFAQIAADIVMDYLLSEPCGVVGFATGTTTSPVYDVLVRRLEEEGTPRFAAFNVDEYLDISPDDSKTCFSRMKAQLYDHAPPAKTICFRSDALDPEEDGQRVLREIDEAGVLGLQILGIGKDGHIGFNDPGTPWELETAVISFSPSSRAGKAEFWGGLDKVPSRGATLGVKGIMKARSLLLLASGESKADIVRLALEGPVTLDVPASVLQLHPFVTVLLDNPAAFGVRKGK